MTNCNYCMECVKFCPHHVFEVHDDQEQKFVVKNHQQTASFSAAPAGKTCGLDAIDFPDKKETTAHIKGDQKGRGRS